MLRSGVGNTAYKHSLFKEAGLETPPTGVSFIREMRLDEERGWKHSLQGILLYGRCDWKRSRVGNANPPTPLVRGARGSGVGNPAYNMGSDACVG